MQQYQQQQQHQQHQQQQIFSGSTPYSQLPDDARRAIDQIYQLMMQHRRTLASVRTMAPSLLTADDDDAAGGVDVAGRPAPAAARRGGGEVIASPADAAAGAPLRRPAPRPSNGDPPNDASLPRQMAALRSQIRALLQSAESNLAEARRLKSAAGEAAAQAKMHGAWPIEIVAARSGVALSSVREMLGDHNHRRQGDGGGVGVGGGGRPASSLNVSGMTNVDAVALQQIMDMRASRVDRVEPMPSPYLWEVLGDFERRVAAVSRDVEAVRARLAIAEEAERLRSAGVGGGAGATRDNASLLLAGGGGGGDAAASLILYEGGGGLAAAAAAAGGGSAPLSRSLATMARSQSDLFLRVAAQAARAHEGLEEAKLRYRRFCQHTRGGQYEDPFLRADVEEFSRERDMQHRILSEQLATALPPNEAATTAFGTTTAPAAPSASASGIFGQPATGLFGTPGEDLLRCIPC